MICYGDRLKDYQNGWWWGERMGGFHNDHIVTERENDGMFYDRIL